jgi:hypothetical protein
LAKDRPAAQQSALSIAMKVVIEVLAAPPMLGETCHARMALAIMADAAEAAATHIGKKDVGAEVYGLADP